MIGKTLIVVGSLLVVLGIFFTFGGRLTWLGRLPGDIVIQKKNFSFYFPVTTSIIVSVLISVILLLLRRR